MDHRSDAIATRADSGVWNEDRKERVELGLGLVWDTTNVIAHLSTR